MMRLNQLLCVVVPLPGEEPNVVAARIAAARPVLDKLLGLHGEVHYATLTLLPESPSATRDPAPVSLALTIAVSDGYSPRDTIERLVSLDQERIISALFFPKKGALESWQLVDLLTQSDVMHVATGGYVGARDRTVSQVQREAALAQRVRDLASSYIISNHDDAPGLASRLSSEILSDPGFSWARQPAPRSRWREGVTPTFLRIGATAGFLVLVMGLLLSVGAVALVGFFSKLLIALLNPVLIGIHDPTLNVRDVYFEGSPIGPWLRGFVFVGLIVNVFTGALSRKRKLPLLAFELTMLLTVLVLLVASPLLGLFALNDLGRAAVAAELSIANTHIYYGWWVILGLGIAVTAIAASSLVALVLTPPYFSRFVLLLVWLVVLSVAAVVVHFSLVATVRIGAHFDWAQSARLLERGTWGWQIIDRVAILIALVAFIVVVAARAAWYFLAQDIKWFPRLNAPHTAPTQLQYGRLHQTSASVDECEAEWSNRTGIMVSLTEVRRPFWLFGRLAHLFLWIIGSLGWHYYSEGCLGEVRTIQFAHWHLVDRGRRLLFCANFDGTFGGYLDDFIAGRLPLLNLIWRWTCLRDRPTIQLGEDLDAVGTVPLAFPRTRLLLFAGCRSEQLFKAYARASMLPFQYHFQAYNESLAGILNATKLRDAISAPRDLASDDVILRATET